MRAKLLLAVTILLFVSKINFAMEEDDVQCPFEIWINIFQDLDFESALNLTLVNKSFLQNLDERAWQRLFVYHHGNYLEGMKITKFKQLCCSLHEPITIASADKGGTPNECYYPNPNLNVECKNVLDENAAMKEHFEQCLTLKPNVLCFPYFLSCASVRRLGSASDFVDGLLTEASKNDIVVILRAQPLTGVYPNVIRVLCSKNFVPQNSDSTAAASPILRFEPQCKGDPVEKLAMLVASLRSIRRDLSANAICLLIENTSSHFSGHEDLRTKKIDEESIWSTILDDYCEIKNNENNVDKR